MKETTVSWYRFALWASILLYSNMVMSDSLVETVAKVKPSVVGIGVYSPMATISNRLDGSGFVVGNGKYVVTNEHVISAELEEGIKSTRVVFVPNGRQTKVIPIDKVMTDAEHDIAILAIGETLPALSLRPRAEVIPLSLIHTRPLRRAE